MLALSLASFAGALNNGITRGEVAASWQTTGADVMVQPGSGTNPVTPTAIKAIAAVHGVHSVTAVCNTLWMTPADQQLGVVAVDPVSYAAMVADTPLPRIPVAAIGTSSGGPLNPGTTVPVLASPSAAASLGRRATQLTSLYAMGPLSVRVTGELGAADRDLTVARLAVMGHERPVGLVMAEVMPAVLAAVIAGAACALALPHLIGSALDLSGFTHNNVPVELQPNLVALALPAAVIVAITAAALVAETRTLRRRDVNGMLRTAAAA